MTKKISLIFLTVLLLATGACFGNEQFDAQSYEAVTIAPDVAEDSLRLISEDMGKSMMLLPKEDVTLWDAQDNLLSTENLFHAEAGSDIFLKQQCSCDFCVCGSGGCSCSGCTCQLQ